MSTQFFKDYLCQRCRGLQTFNFRLSLSVLPDVISWALKQLLALTLS